MPQDAIGETGVADVLPRHVVKRLRAVRRPHAVDLHDDEAELGLRLRGRETALKLLGTCDPCGPA